MTVIVASVSGLPIVCECLDALSRQETKARYEILVVDASNDRGRARLRGYAAPVRLIEVEGRPSIPELRSIGVAAARADTLAWVEDHCIVAPTFVERALRDRGDGWQVIGGPLRNGCTDRLTDRAVFLSEYAALAPPLPAGETDAVASCCIYDRRLFDDLPCELANDWEPFLHGWLRGRGVRFYCDPELESLHKQSLSLVQALGQRYYYSRSCAAQRSRHWPRWRRRCLALGMPFLPMILLLRLLFSVRAKGELLRWVPATAPHLLMLYSIGAWGETMGLLRGARESTSRVGRARAE